MEISTSDIKHNSLLLGQIYGYEGFHGFLLLIVINRKEILIYHFRYYL